MVRKQTIDLKPAPALGPRVAGVPDALARVRFPDLREASPRIGCVTDRSVCGKVPGLSA
ncbi:MAG TPA: hypothetical protein VIK01_25540 [Polyangiaceae bacterium]